MLIGIYAVSVLDVITLNAIQAQQKFLRDIFKVAEEDIDVLVELIGGVETAKD